MRRALLASMKAVLIVTIMATPGWSGNRPSASGAAQPRSVDAAAVFVASDYGFRGPDRIPAGLTTVRIVNEGHDLHHVQVLKLLQGKSAADFHAAVAADPSRLPSWVRYVGGPNAVVPGHEAVATMHLTEGEHVMICLIPDNKGVLHVALGMEKAVTVQGGKPSKVSEPKATLAITQSDFHFSVAQPIQAGAHTVAVTNQGTQPHEVVLVRLEPGSSVTDFLASVEPGAAGPPKGMPLGGIVGIEPGDRGFFTADLEPGRYGLVCFFPNPSTGKPHFLHGMTTEFTVK